MAVINHKVLRCLFWKQREQISSVLLEDDGMYKVLRPKGEMFVPLNAAYWEHWKNASGFCKGDKTDFCLIYDTPIDGPAFAPSENPDYRGEPCSPEEGKWSIERISHCAKALKIPFEVELHDTANRFLGKLKGNGGEQIILYADFTAPQSEKTPKKVEPVDPGDCTPFIRYWINQEREASDQK